MSDIPHPASFARSHPDRPAFILYEDGATLSYGALAERSARAANLLASLGVQEGDTIAILMENNIRYPELLWAAKDSGLRYVSISSHLNAADAAYIITDCGARAVIASHALGELACASVAKLAHQPILLMVGGAHAPFADYESLLASQPARPIEGRRRGASMLYSSGTTGRPKGVRTQIAEVAPSVPPARFGMLIEQYGFDENSLFLNPAPFYHAGPQRFMMTVHRSGGTVLAFRNFDAETLLRAMADHAATHGFMVPTMFARLLAADPALRSRVDLTRLRHMIHGAAPCPVDVKRAMIDWWGPVIDELYSGTEAIGHTFITSREWLEHPGSVGKPASNCTIRIVDDQGNQLPPGVPGRILMSNGLDVAYHGAAADKALRGADGFGSLGDIGYVDADGYLYLTDRESHMIIAGGVNIYPQEAEAVLISHPMIADVAVIGVPHPDMGEEVKAVVQPASWPDDEQAAAQDIIEYCRARLSLHKCPHTVDFVAEMPRNALGKLLKKDLRQHYWKDRSKMI